jgi:lactoylglutathione lyase
MSSESPVRELRVALTVDDYEQALRFYRDALGLPLVSEWEGGAVLDAGRATLEVLSRPEAERVDQVEVGQRVGATVRLALEVDDSAATAETLTGAGAELIGGPVVTPWSHRNVRVRAPEGTQLTLFTVLETPSAPT